MSPAQQLLMLVLMRRGVTLSELEGSGMITGSLGVRERVFLGGYTSLLPQGVGMILTNKFLTKQVLSSEGINVAKGQVFQPHQHRQAGWYAEEELGFPVLIRQENAQRGDKAILDLQSRVEVMEAFKKLAQIRENILVEKMMVGTRYLAASSLNGYQGMWQIENENISMPESDQTDKMLRAERKKLNLGLRNFIGKSEQHAVGIQSIEFPFRYQNKIFTQAPALIQKNFEDLGSRVLKAFPGLPIVTFEIIVSGDSDYALTEVYHSLGPVAFLQLKKQNEKMRGVDVLVELLFPMYGQ